MSKKILFILPMIAGLYYFFTRTEKGKEYALMMGNKIKKSCPCFMIMPKMIEESLEKFKNDMKKKEEDGEKEKKKGKN